jgi:hypothetical protein
MTARAYGTLIETFLFAGVLHDLLFNDDIQPFAVFYARHK